MKLKIYLFNLLLLFACQALSTGTKLLPFLPLDFSEFFLNDTVRTDTNSKESTAVHRLPDDEEDDEEEETHNLWSVIASDLKMNVPENARIRTEKIRYLKHKQGLHEVILRAEPYMHWIVEKIQARKMPMELVLLPIIESAFNPKVTSSAKAAGIWQIMPKTGHSYGLKQNQWYDGRRDLAASTDMVLDYMTRLNKLFNGDWLLAIAAYNAGETRVMKAIKRNRLEGKATDFWHLSLPLQTTLYVPKLLALSEILKNSEKYEVQLPTTDEGRALSRVEMGKQVKLANIAKLAGLPLSSFKTFNTAYKGDTTAPNGPHYVMLPKINAEQLRDSLAAEGDTLL